MEVGEACQVQVYTIKILNSIQYGLFFYNFPWTEHK